MSIGYLSLNFEKIVLILICQECIVVVLPGANDAPGTLLNLCLYKKKVNYYFKDATGF